MRRQVDNTSSLMKLIGDAIASHWDKTAFVDYGTDISYTYKELFEKITKIHIFLELYGIKPGDKVALCDKNSSNWAVAFLALFTYKAVVVPLLPDFHIQQVMDLTRHSDSKLLLTNRSVYNNAPSGQDMMIDVKTRRPFHPGTPMEEAFTRMNDEFSRRFPEGVKPEHVHFDDEDKEALAIISYTSGSTGNPKGVMLPYRAIWSNNLYARTKFPLTDDRECLSLLPLSHMFGMAFELFFPITTGCKINFLTKIPSPQIVIKAFKEVKPILIILVPLIIEKIIQTKVFPELRKPKTALALKIPGIRKIIYSQVRKKLSKTFGGSFYQVIGGGAALNKEVGDFLQKIKFRYTSGYGMTECAPLITYVDWKGYIQNSCGRSVDRMEIEILSDDPENVPGEIICKGANMMMGYYKNPEATAETIDKDGWLHTGDLGTMDRKGNLFIRGRKKNMLLGANGQNVYPEEIEDVLSRQELIDECVIVQRDQKLVGLVYTSDDTLKNNHVSRKDFEASLDDIRNVVNQQLPKFARLSHLEIHEGEFEKTPKKNIKRFLYK